MSMPEERPSCTPGSGKSPIIRTSSFASVSCFSVCFALFSPAAYALPGDHIVAAVNNEVITASLLARLVPLNEPLSQPEADGKTLKSETREGLINRRLLDQTAMRLKFVEISDQETQSAVDRLRSLFGSDDAFTEFLNMHGMSQKKLSPMVGEQLLVRKFVENKVELSVRVMRDEARDYFDTHIGEFTGKQFQDFQKGLMARLTNAKIDQQLDRHLANLRTKADMRINPL